MKVLLIGYGNIGKTFVDSWVRTSALSPGNISILLKEGCSTPNTHLPYHFYSRIDEVPFSTCPLIILAVKPQDFITLAQTLKNQIPTDSILLSVMAGISTQSIREHLGVAKIIRSMPNLPALINQGMTVYTATEEVTKNELAHIHNLLSATGKCLYTDKEDMINAATAVSGSGPAYLFYFAQCMMEAAEAQGFSPSEAHTLVQQTLTGSLAMLQGSADTPEEWIQKVASKGGTTEAALAVFSEAGFRDMLQAGISRATERARELGA